MLVRKGVIHSKEEPGQESLEDDWNPGERRVPPSRSFLLGGAFRFCVWGLSKCEKTCGVVSKKKEINGGVVITAIMTGSAE
jgi:hypothetical protein